MPFIHGKSTPAEIRAKGVELQEKLSELCEGLPLESIAYALHWMLCGEAQLQEAMDHISASCAANKARMEAGTNVIPFRDPKAN